MLNDCKYSDEVATRCVLELAGDGVLRTAPGPGGVLTISLGAASPLSGPALRPFEKVVLARIRGRAARHGEVPLPALLSDDGDDYEAWRKRLTNALGRQARQAGLVTRLATKGEWYILLGLTVVVVCVCVGAFLASPHDGETALTLGGIVVAVVTLALLFAGHWRPTPEGAALVAWYRQEGALPQDPGVDDTALVSTAAPGSGPGGAPLPSGQVWSSFGGHWHPVSVGAPGELPPGSALRGPGAPRRVTMTGEVVKRWKYEHDDDPTLYRVCIDDGSSGEGVTFTIREALYKKIGVGDVVRVTYSPRQMYVHNIKR